MVRKLLIILFLCISAVTAHANSLQLGGTNGMVTFPYDTTYDNLPLDYHIKFRIDVLSTVKGEHQTLKCLEKSGGYIWCLQVSNVDNKLHFTTNSGSGVDVESNSALEVGKKYQALITIDSSRNVKMYIDQQIRGPDVVASDLLQSDQPITDVLDTTSPGDLVEGCRSGGTDCLDGTIFESTLFSANPATFPVISLFDGLKIETDLIAYWPHFDGIGGIIWDRYQSRHGINDGVLSGDYSWNIDEYNFMIEDEYKHYYFPQNSGTMDINSGIVWEGGEALYDQDDYSWNDMRQVTECTGTADSGLPIDYYNPETCEQKCDREWWTSDVRGNDTTGDGSFVNPWKTLGKTMESYVSRPYYRDCFYIESGDYYETPGLYYSAENLDDPIGSEKNRIWIGAVGDGPVRIHGHDTNDMVWSTHSGQIVKANYQDDANVPFFRVSNLILDDNFPDCCEKMEDIGDLSEDGDWFVDEKSGTTTSSSASKLIDSTANFGGESLPTEVGFRLINTATGQTAEITAIDSTTQLSLDTNIFTTSGQAYRIYGDMYIYLDSGSNPFTDRNAVVTGKGENIAYGFSATMPHITIFGVEFIGSQSYSINAFSTAPAEDFDIVRVRSKYSKGLAFSGKDWRMIQNRTHGNINAAVGNGVYFGAGSLFGWPSDVNAGDDSPMMGNIASWAGGECFGGQFSDNKRVEWNIAVNCWSVAYYAADASKNLTLKNNVAMVHRFMPHYVSKDPTNEIQRVWNRMISQGILNGDEEAPYTQHFDISNNLILGTQRFIDQFSSCGVSVCHGFPFPDEPSASGWKYITLANNVFIAPSYPGRIAGLEWLGMSVGHQSGPINDASVGSMFINNFTYFPDGGYHSFWWTNTLIPEPDVHLVDYNYYLSKYPHAFQWRAVKYDFEDFKTQSGYDANSTFKQPEADGTVNVNLMTRTDWDLEGTTTFKFSDFYPVAGSVLINSGHTFDLTGTWSYHDFQWDLRGNRRAIGSATDIGIFSTEPWIRTLIGNGTVNGGSF